jgi:hypothetical protein
MHRVPSRLTALALLIVLAAPAGAFVSADKTSALAAKETPEAALEIDPRLLRTGELPGELAADFDRSLALLGIDRQRAALDAGGGRWASLWLRQPLIPGDGVGNQLTWDGLGTPGGDLSAVVADRFLAWVAEHSSMLRIDPAELSLRVGVHENGRLIQIHGAREVGGIPVRGAGVGASLKAGNLVLFGADKWGDLDLDLQPALSAAAARERLAGYVAPESWTGERDAAHLEILPLAVAGDFGEGYTHRLVWVLTPDFPDVLANYEALVDAHSGEVVAFRDTNHYERQVKGGVYPLSNDGMAPDGVEVAEYPMPFADVAHDGGGSTTDAGGNVLDAVGVMTTTLAGPFLRIQDTCGSISESSTADGDIDLGTSGGTDCTTPPGASLGNTHSARSVFYEVNRLAEIGRGHLPANGWLQSQLTAQTNISTICNAFWTGSVIQFFRETGTCANLGEITNIVNHEWGHGMDDNGTNGSVSSPGEGVADLYAALRHARSCSGRGAFTSTCGGFGDACTLAFGCTGARDIDWERHDSMTPHDVTWVLGNPQCGGVHCRGTIYGEAVWDLYKRDLPALHGFDDNTSLEIVMRLLFLGADNVGTWYSLSNGDQGGCSATSGYQQFLVTDDDNGDLGDGTPHMQAIFDAFDRHEIACATPTVTVGGCAGRPTAGPAVAAIGADLGAELSWSAVAGATRYKIYRTDGELECEYGKAIVGEVTGTTFSDSGLLNGREYYYVVAGFNASDSCMGPTSPCTPVTAGQDAMIFTDGFESGDTSLWDASAP